MRNRLVWAVLVLTGAFVSAPVASAAATHDFELRVLSSPATMVTGGRRSRRAGDPAERPAAQGEAVRERRDVTSTLELDELGAHAHRHGDRPAPRLEHALRRLERPRQRPADGRADAREPPGHRADLLGTAAAAVRLQDPDAGARVPAGGQPGGDRHASLPDARQSGHAARRLEQGLHGQHGRRLPVPQRPAGQFRPLPAGPLPADVATTTTLDGRTVPYVVRRERGTINRFIYAISILSPPGDPAAAPDTSLWNGRADLHVRRRRRDRPQPGHGRRQPPLRHRASRRATRSSTRAGRARRRTTTSSSAPRRRS